MSQQGEPGHPGLPGEPGTGHAGGSGGTGGGGGTGGTGTTGGTGGPGGTGGTGGPGASVATTTRALVGLLLVSLFLAAGNLLFTAAVVHRADVTRARADAQRASITQLCKSGNEFRHEQIQLWEFLIGISRPPPHQTPAEKRQREKTTHLFLAHIQHVFAPRNCPRE